MRLSRRRPPEDLPEGPTAAPDGPAAAPPPGPRGPVPAPARDPAAVGDQSAAAAGAAGGDGSASLAAALVVSDELEPRIRLPSDLLRCVTFCIEIALLVGIGLLGKAAASGVETDVVKASERVASHLISPLHSIAFIALLVLPVALAVRLVIIGQLRRLAEAVVIGLVAAGVTIACNAVLSLHALAELYVALARAGSPQGATLLDPYLAGLAAYLTVISLTGRPRWRTWFSLAIVFYCVTSLVEAGTSGVLSLLLTLLIGAAAGSGLRYLIGTNSERPTAAEIAAALSAASVPVVAIWRMPDSTTENRRYAARTQHGVPLDVTVFDQDQQAADALYRIYRRLRLTSQVSRSAPLTVSRAVERRALMAYAVEDAGVSTPRLEAAVRVGPEAAAIATRHTDGATLAELAGPPPDLRLSQVWDAVLQLHRHRVTHRSLTSEHIQLSGQDGSEVTLLEPGDGDVAATDLQLRLDLAELTATMALLVGPERAADMASAKLGSASVASLVPLLQPLFLHRSTRAQLRRHKDVLPVLRRRFLGGEPEVEVPPEQLERIRPRRVATLVAAIVAAYFVIGQFGRRNFIPVLRQSDWRWVLVGLALSALTYVGATLSLSGFVLEKLSWTRTLLAQLAGSFVTLVTPAAVGGVALNIRYLHKAKVPPADAASSVGVSQVFAFALHMLLLVLFIALAGGSHSTPFHPPGWSYIALGVLGVAVLAVFALPAGRRLVRSRVAPALGQVMPRLLDIAQRPAKLAEGTAGALLLTLCYILCLDASVRAVGWGHAPFFAIAVVYLTGNAIGSVVPTPGGLGAVEVALSGGLTTIAHVPGAFALSAVLVFRLLSFWLPIPIGWVALNYLQRHDAL
jgi:glycosyltransferase 2 family protein